MSITSLNKPCIDPHATTPQGKAANLIGEKCLGRDNTCSHCNLALFLQTLHYRSQGMTLKKAYKTARDKQDNIAHTSLSKYDREEMETSR